LHLIFDDVWDSHVYCDYDTASTVKFAPVRNASYYVPVGASSGDFAGDEGDFSSQTDFDGPVSIILLLTSDSSAVTDSDITLTSTNPNLLKAESMSIVDDGAGGFTFAANPEDFAVGSTTVGIVVGGVEVTSFTLCFYQMPYCPFPVKFLGASVLPITYTNFVISASVIFQAIFFVFFAGLGDFGPYRKQILLQTGLGGALTCMTNLFFTTGDDYANAGAIFIVTNLLFGASMVMYNAYLPFITKSHPTFQTQMVEFKKNKAGGAMKMGKALKELLACYADLQDAISSKGFLYGYSSGFIMVIITFIVIMQEPNMFGIR
jgi:hypothetical protein